MTNSPASQATLAVSPASDFRKALRPWLKPKIIMGGSLVFLLVFMGVLAPILSPHDPNLQNLTNTLQAPNWWGGAHFLGTDHVGRDILSRIFYGARISLVIAGTVVIISRDDYDGSRDDQRNSGTIKNAAQYVPTDMISAKKMRTSPPVRSLQSVCQVL